MNYSNKRGIISACINCSLRVKYTFCRWEAFIGDMGNKRVVILDIINKKFSTYRQFDQPVWQYRQNGTQELFRLQDGLYEE